MLSFYHVISFDHYDISTVFQVELWQDFEDCGCVSLAAFGTQLLCEEALAGLLESCRSWKPAPTYVNETSWAIQSQLRSYLIAAASSSVKELLTDPAQIASAGNFELVSYHQVGEAFSQYRHTVCNSFMCNLIYESHLQITRIEMKLALQMLLVEYVRTQDMKNSFKKHN